MAQLPPAIPNLLPDGAYDFKIVDVKEFQSSYGGGSYHKIYFLVKNSDGEVFDFSTSVNPKMKRYREILLALGVEPDEQGFLRPPDDVTGMKFMGEIYQREAANDKSKTVNDIRNLRPLTATKAKTPLPPEEDPADDSEVPF